MARSGRKTAGGADLADLFAAGADAAVLSVLRESTRAMVKAEILDRLEAGGVSRLSAYDLTCRCAYDLICRSVFGELSPTRLG